jgi:tyrosyl-tRNA synthetase
VERYLKMFTFLALPAIAEVMAAHEPDRARRVAQRRLADEVTTWVHGAEATRRAVAVSHVLFGGAVADLTDADLEPILADAPATDVPRGELDAGLGLLDLLVRTGIAESKGEARRLVAQGGAYVNNVRVEDPNRSLTGADLATESMIVLRGGKKKYRIVRALRT